MDTFLTAAIQLNSRPDLKHSMDLAQKAVEQAVSKGAAWIGLPENFAFLGDEKEKHRKAEAITNTVLNTVPEWAKEYGVFIMAGGFPVRTKRGKVYNRAIMVDPGGSIVAAYDKIHLFDISLSEEESYRESDTVEAGRHEAVVCGISWDTKCSNSDPSERNNRENIHFGLSICYDLRFPELYRRLADRGAEVLCIPAAFTRPTGTAHWEVLLRARAIENSCYVIAPAQTGQHGEKRKTHGHSMIIDPWGKVLSDAGTEPGMALAEINPGYVLEIREKVPSLRHRVF